jgi:hypothetical protein
MFRRLNPLGRRPLDRRAYWHVCQVLVGAVAAVATTVPSGMLSASGQPAQAAILTSSNAAATRPGVWFASQAGLTSEDLGALGKGQTPPASLAPAAVPPGDAANPVAINATGTRLIAGITDSSGHPQGAVVLDPRAGSVVGKLSPHASGFAPVAFAADPTDPAIMWAVETDISADFGTASGGEVFRIDVNTLGEMLWATLPSDGANDITPSSAVIAPDGKRLFVGWGDSSSPALPVPRAVPFASVSGYGVDSVPVGSGPNPPVARWTQPGGPVRTGPPTPNNSENGAALPDVTDLAISPDGSQLFVAAVSPAGSLSGPSGALYQLPSTLPSSSTPVPTRLLSPDATSLAEPLAIAVSPDGTTVYAAGVGAQPTNPGNAASFVESFHAEGLTAQTELAVPDIGAGFDPSGINAMAVSPDGKTLIVVGYDQNSSPNQTAAHAIPLLPAGAFGPLGPRVTITSKTPAQDYAPAYGVQGIAITPDQAPVAHLAPAGGIVGAPVTLDASSSTVAFGSIVRYAWSFGDGHTAVTTTPTVAHTYSAPSPGYAVTVTETDSAGNSIPPAPFSSARPVNTSGKTPYLNASFSARTSESVTISSLKPPPSTTTTNTPPPPATTTPPPPAKSTTPAPPTTLTAAAQPPPPQPRRPATPHLVLTPNIGPPGTIVTVSGTGFSPNTVVTVKWSVSVGSLSVRTDAHGNLPPSQLLIVVPDILGPRLALSSSTPAADAAFLVVPNSLQPGGGQGLSVFRSEGP